MTKTRKIDRRREFRYPVRVPVTVVARGDALHEVRGHTIDISRHGLRVVTDADLNHRVLQTLLMDGGGQPIVARIDIITTERRGSQWVHGLFIAEIDTANEERLIRLCLARA